MFLASTLFQVLAHCADLDVEFALGLRERIGVYDAGERLDLTDYLLAEAAYILSEPCFRSFSPLFSAISFTSSSILANLTVRLNCLGFSGERQNR